MKINWGWKIFILYTVFILVTGGMILFTTFINNDKVVENYYEEETKYQDYIDKVKRTEALHIKPTISIKENILEIFFPDSLNHSPNGDVKFFRPDNKMMDFSQSLKIDSLGKQYINLNDLVKGRWEVSLDWQSENLTYIIKQIIWLN